MAVGLRLNVIDALTSLSWVQSIDRCRPTFINAKLWNSVTLWPDFWPFDSKLIVASEANTTSRFRFVVGYKWIKKPTTIDRNEADWIVITFNAVYMVYVPVSFCATFTNQFSGPDSTQQSVRHVCLCVRTITFELKNLWPRKVCLFVCLFAC